MELYGPPNSMKTNYNGEGRENPSQQHIMHVTKSGVNLTI